MVSQIFPYQPCFILVFLCYFGLQEVLALQDWREKAMGRLKTLEKRAAWAFLGVAGEGVASQAADWTVEYLSCCKHPWFPIEVLEIQIIYDYIINDDINDAVDIPA